MGLLSYMYGILVQAYMVFFQKLSMRHLPDVDQIGGPVTGLTIIVTGPTSGIGRETARVLVRRGANVVLACRSLSKGQALKAELEDAARREAQPAPKLEVRQLDLASLQSVRDFCRAWRDEARPLHVLINNAGVLTFGAPRRETDDGLEINMATNHLGHFLLTLMLLPALRLGARGGSFGARVVNVASSMHLMTPGIDIADPLLAKPGAYGSAKAYGNSKMAQIMFARELRRRLRYSDPSISVFALHPGMVLTDVARSLGDLVFKAYKIIMGTILLTAPQGARATVYCSTDPRAPAEAEKTCGYFDADCRPMQPGPLARDDTTAAWCWRWSAQQVQLPAEFNVDSPVA